MIVTFEDGFQLRLGIVDRFIVTRVAPQFDAGGNVTRVDFWLLFRLPGYQEESRHAHDIKVVSWSQDDTNLLNLIDDRGRRFHIKLISPDLDPDDAADWKYWQDYRAKNLNRFKKIDPEVLDEHIYIAENWK